jgi:hypothetical protein
MVPNRFDQNFNSLLELYIFNVAEQCIGDAYPEQQKAMIDLLLSINPFPPLAPAPFDFLSS